MYHQRVTSFQVYGKGNHSSSSAARQGRCPSCPLTRGSMRYQSTRLEPPDHQGGQAEAEGRPVGRPVALDRTQCPEQEEGRDAGRRQHRPQWIERDDAIEPLAVRRHVGPDGSQVVEVLEVHRQQPGQGCDTDANRQQRRVDEAREGDQQGKRDDLPADVGKWAHSGVTEKRGLLGVELLRAENAAPLQ